MCWCNAIVKFLLWNGISSCFYTWNNRFWGEIEKQGSVNGTYSWIGCFEVFKPLYINFFKYNVSLKNPMIKYIFPFCSIVFLLMHACIFKKFLMKYACKKIFFWKEVCIFSVYFIDSWLSCFIGKREGELWVVHAFQKFNKCAFSASWYSCDEKYVSFTSHSGGLESMHVFIDWKGSTRNSDDAKCSNLHSNKLWEER